MDQLDRERFKSEIRYRLRVASDADAAAKVQLRWFLLGASVLCFGIAIWG